MSNAPLPNSGCLYSFNSSGIQLSCHSM
jgi:hypothetical protein